MTGSNMSWDEVFLFIPIGNAPSSGSTTSSYAFGYMVVGGSNYGTVLAPEANLGHLQGPVNFIYGVNNPLQDPSITTGSTTVSKGAIIGVVVGALVVVAAAVLIGRYLRRKAQLRKDKAQMEGKTLEEEEQKKKTLMVRPMQMVMGQTWQEQLQRIKQQQELQLPQEHQPWQGGLNNSGSNINVYNNVNSTNVGKFPVESQREMGQIPFSSHPQPRVVTTAREIEESDLGQGVGAGNSNNNSNRDGVWRPRPFVPLRPVQQENQSF